MRQEFTHFLKEWILPPGPLDLLMKVKRELISQTILGSEDRKILAQNVQFRNMCAGKRCFVIGNGPSLNRQNLTPLANEITIVMNHFHLHPVLQRWQPTFWCLADPPNCYTPQEIDRVKVGMTRTNPQAFFVPIDMKSLNDQYQIFPLEKTYFLKMDGGSMTDWPHSKPLDFTKNIPSARTTAHLAIMLAMYLGCSKIYLLGLDHDWLAHRSVMTHFYDSVAREEEGSSNDLSGYNYKSLVEGTLKTWEIYEALKDLSAIHNTKIFNATDGGFLDVFPRVKYESLF
jgi:hypothetical protein